MQNSSEQDAGFPENAHASGGAYTIVLLGDTHYDTAYDVYHKNYAETDSRLSSIQKSEFARNAEMWTRRCPALLAAAAEKARLHKAKFVLQLGDLIQGDCGCGDVHARMLADVFQIFKSAIHDRPFLTVKGNHDFRGPGADEAYRRVMPPLLSAELGRTVSGPNFSFRVMDDLFMFVDFSFPDMAFLRDTLEQNRDARYKFVVSHGSVLPSDYYVPFWFLHGNDPAARAESDRLFFEHHVIVLSGHTHYLEFLECANRLGIVTQLVVNSVWTKETPLVPRVLANTVPEYGKRQAPDSKEAALLAPYRESALRYCQAEAAGYALLRIGPDGVFAEFFAGASGTPSMEFRLRPSGVYPEG